MIDNSDAPPSYEEKEGKNDSFLRPVSNFLMRIIGLRPGSSVRLDLEEALSDEGGQDPSFSEQERSMLSNILSLRERRVEDVMVPRADIIAVDHNSTMGELIEIFREAGHSRLPVYHETLDDLVGMVHIRDFLNYLTTSAPRKPGHEQIVQQGSPELGTIDLSARLADANIIRRVLFAPPSMPALDLLLKMQSTRIHMGLVIDEYGGTDGLVSIEDIIEEVVGEIEDEHDEDEQTIIALENGGWLASARASLDEVKDFIGESFDLENLDDELSERAEDIDTLGGLMIAIVGRVPARGELIKGPDGFEFEVLDADPRRVKRLRIKQRSSENRPRPRDQQRDAGFTLPPGL